MTKSLKGEESGGVRAGGDEGAARREVSLTKEFPLLTSRLSSPVHTD